MAKDINAARSSHNLGIFKEAETDWVFSKIIMSQAAEGAAQSGECIYTAKQINEKNAESWITAWSSLAERVYGEGEKNLRKGNIISARESFLRASTYYHSAERGCLPDDKRFRLNWENSRTAFRESIKLFDFDFLESAVPLNNWNLPSYYIPAEKKEKAPTVIIAGGNDSSLEMIAVLYGFAAHRRGFNFFTFEHPGHRGAVHLYPDCVKRHDYEIPYGKALDLLQTMPGTDERIGIAGLSFGGYIAPRVAASDKRIKACAAASPLIDLWETGRAFWKNLDKINKIPPPVLSYLWNKKLKNKPIVKAFQQYSNWTNGFHGLDVREKLARMELFWRDFTLEGRLENIQCPVLSLVGEDEGEELLRQAALFHESLRVSDKTLKILSLEKEGTSDHCQLDNIAAGQAILFDWFSRVLK